MKSKVYWTERNELWERVKERYEGSESDLYEAVHALMAFNASAISNSGLQKQFDYLCSEAGLDWVKNTLLKDDDDDDDDDDGTD